MGFWTVVMLSNDQAHEWSHDAALGKKILSVMNRWGSDANIGGYGRVVQCVHAGQQTLAVLDGYTSFEAVQTKGWARGEDKGAITMALLKDAARALGYNLVKRRTAK